MASRSRSSLGILPDQSPRLYGQPAKEPGGLGVLEAVQAIASRIDLEFLRQFGIDDALIQTGKPNEFLVLLSMPAEDLFRLSPRYARMQGPGEYQASSEALRKLNRIFSSISGANYTSNIEDLNKSFKIQPGPGTVVMDAIKVKLNLMPHPMTPVYYYSVAKDKWFLGSKDSIRIIPDACSLVDPKGYGSADGPVLIRSPAGILTNIAHTVTDPAKFSKKKTDRLELVKKIASCGGIPWGSWSVAPGIHAWAGIVTFYADVSLLKNNFPLTGSNPKKQKGFTLTAWDAWTARSKKFKEIQFLPAQVITTGKLGPAFLLSEYLAIGLDTSDFESADIKDLYFRRHVEVPVAQNWSDIDDALRNIIRARKGEQQVSRFRGASFDSAGYLELKFTDMVPLSSIPLAVTRYRDPELEKLLRKGGFKGKLLTIPLSPRFNDIIGDPRERSRAVDAAVYDYARENNKIIVMAPSTSSGTALPVSPKSSPPFVFVKTSNPELPLINNTEVTNEVFEQIMGSGYPKTPPLGPKDPVTGVSWDSAVLFCIKYTEYLRSRGWKLTQAYTMDPVPNGDPIVKWNKKANGVRLPTYKEYKKIIDGESVNALYIPKFAWTANNSGGSPHPVGLLQPDYLGLYDIRGNVSEWLWDPYLDMRTYFTSNYSNYVTRISPTERTSPKYMFPFVGFRVCVGEEK